MQTLSTDRPPRRPAPALAWEDKAEIVSGLLSLPKRDYVGFGLSVADLVPLQGEAAFALKIAQAA